MTAWWIVGERVEQFVRYGDVKVTKLDHLLPYEQEVMCAEFLRGTKAAQHGLPRLACLSALIGSTRKAVDFAGVTESGGSILAQVTHCEDGTAEFRDKLNALREVGSEVDAEMTFFCRTDKPRSEEGIRIFSTQTVFDLMKENPAWRVAVGIKV